MFRQPPDLNIWERNIAEPNRRATEANLVHNTAPTGMCGKPWA